MRIMVEKNPPNYQFSFKGNHEDQGQPQGLRATTRVARTALTIKERVYILMKYFKNSLAISFLWIFSSAFGSVNSLSYLYPINWSGTDALRSGAYQTALQEVLADSLVSDTVYHYFKLACIHRNLKNLDKSLFLFKYVAQKCSVLAPVCYEQIGDLQLDSDQKQNVLFAYNAALKHNLPKKYRNQIFSKISQLEQVDSSDLKKKAWYSDYVAWYDLQSKKTLKEDRYDSLVKKGEWKLIDSLLESAQKSDSQGTPGCAEVLSIISSEGVDSLSAANLFYLSRISFSCKKNETAISLLQKAKKKPEFKSVSQSKALYLEAQILYNQGKTNQALNLFKSYEARYGTSADLILYMARGYRKLGKSAEADRWYSKLVELYPSHKKAHEVIWLRAWTREEKKDFAGAAKLYQQIYSSRGKNDYREEAYLRQALAYYRMEKYDSAINILNKFKRQYPGSSFCHAADFWKAKCLFSRGSILSAKNLFRQIIQLVPYDYYAHRSNQMLHLLGDSIQAYSDTSYDVLSALNWLDSIKPAYPGKELSPADSADLKRGFILASVGMSSVAEYFLESFESSFPGNLTLQFRLASLYKSVGAFTQAFRVARRLIWRIPLQEHCRIPLAVYSLLYPSFYDDMIRNHGSVYNVDPFLISSVIRQESIFNPVILSPVGAVGLMQIMPYTGKYIAQQLKEDFFVDSLTRPGFNIRYGVYYLRELLDQFNENLVLVLASYNGGPHNAKKWYERNKHEEFDLFVEDLLFSETRNYVKKVLGNYWTYQNLARNPGLKNIYYAKPEIPVVSASDSINVKTP